MMNDPNPIKDFAKTMARVMMPPSPSDIKKGMKKIKSLSNLNKKPVDPNPTPKRAYPMPRVATDSSPTFGSRPMYPMPRSGNFKK